MTHRSLARAGTLAGTLAALLTSAACANDRDQLAPDDLMERTDKSRYQAEEQRMKAGQQHLAQTQVSLREADAIIASARASALAARAEASADDAQATFERDRAAVVTQASANLALLDAQIAALELAQPTLLVTPGVIPGVRPDEAPEAESVVRLRAARIRANTELGRLRTATAAQWDERVDDAVAAFHDLEQARAVLEANL